MPIYEYECTSCDLSFEKREGFDAESKSVCPRCHNEARRVFRPAPIIFKGSGFYVTDHAKKSATVSNSKSEGREETKQATKSDSQAAAPKAADGE